MFDPTTFRGESATTERIDAHRATARRVLRELFEIDADTLGLSDATTLSDLSEHVPAGAAVVMTARAWAICVKERVFANFGIDCEVDEPLVELLVRLESAEHGIRFVSQN